jgi:7-carboxy-7-deazaguanine synthase
MPSAIETKTAVITEIYKSVQGESSYAGLPCTFIRLTGCPLRCRWCDTVYSFQGGQTLTLDQIVGQVKELGVQLVELTGGEPLAQSSCPNLAKMLCDAGFKVLIETSGSEDIGVLDPRVHVIMDLKAPGSKMVERNLWSNIPKLKATDEVKIVIADRDDFDWAYAEIKKHELESRCHVLLSPAFGLLQPKDLVEWMLETKIQARLNLQQHKFIWHPRAKGV